MLIEVRQQEDVCILRLSGSLLTGTDAGFLQDKTDEVKRLNCHKVLADLRELVSIGSTGIAFLLGIYTSLSRNPRGRFVLVDPQPRVREVFEVTRLGSVLPIVQDVASGMAALADDIDLPGRDEPRSK